LIILSFLALLLIALTACEPLDVPVMPVEETVAVEDGTPVETVTPGPVPPTPTPTEVPLKVWLDPALPLEIAEKVGFALENVERAISPDEAAIKLSVGSDDSGDLVSEWVYALAAPFATVRDSISSTEFVQFWQNGSQISGDAPNELVMSESSFAALTALYGQPLGKVSILPAEDLLARSLEKSAWAVIPFESIEPQWKIIHIDGQSPIQKAFDSESYPLSLPISLLIDRDEVQNVNKLDEIEAQIRSAIPKTNREPEKLTTVILTGVTALTRATATEMEIKGVLAPAESIGETMREADIAHVSNEVPFARDCPEPDWTQEIDLVFCSNDKYIDLLKEIGTDVVELTGDHFRDWGPEAMLHTLEIYNEAGMDYFGGGKDIAEAKAPLKLEHNGNKIAFIGCNAKAPGYATASESNPGAYHCDFDYMVSEIQELKAEGYQVIATFQHDEIYLWEPEPNMREDFRKLAEAGATIVSGSQAHQPHVYEFRGESFIHYGLGNLFFDQLGWYDDSDKAFLDRHVFYDGKYLGVELLTVQFFNWSTPTLMTEEARSELLTRLFEYSQNLEQ
jgi:poly-gamma-glutamate synthesis protein (capsule biosynthesis protein)